MNKETGSEGQRTGDEREVRGEVEWQIERREGRPVIVALKYHFGSEL